MGWLLHGKQKQKQNLNAGNHEVSKLSPKAAHSPITSIFQGKSQGRLSPLMIMSFSSFILHPVQPC